MHKVTVIGHFGFGRNLNCIHSLNASRISRYLRVQGSLCVCELDTYNWAQNRNLFFRKIDRVFRNSDTIILVPAYHGLCVFAPLLARFRRKYAKKLIYYVAGERLLRNLQENPELARALRAFDALWIQCHSLQTELMRMGFAQVNIVENAVPSLPLCEK